MQLNGVLGLESLRQLTQVNLSLVSLEQFSSMTSVLITMELPGIMAPNSTITSQIMTSLSAFNQTQSLLGVNILRGGGYHEGSKGLFVSGA